MTEEQILKYVDRLYYFYESPDCYTSDNKISNFIDKPMSSIMNIGIAYVICYKTIHKFNTPFELSPKQIDEGYTIKDLCNAVIEYDLKKDHTLPTKKCSYCGVEILESSKYNCCKNCTFSSEATTIQCNIRRLKDIVKLIEYGKKRESILKDFEEIEYIAQSDEELELLQVMGLEYCIEKQCDYCDLSCTDSEKNLLNRPCRFKELNGKYTIFKRKNFNAGEDTFIENSEIKQETVSEEFEVETLKIIDRETRYTERVKNAKLNRITSWDSPEGQMFIKQSENAKCRRKFQKFSKAKLFTGLCYYINSKITGYYKTSDINIQSELKEIVSKISFWEKLLSFLTEKYGLDLILSEEQYIKGYTLENLCDDILIITKIREDSNGGIDNFIKNA